MVGYIMLNTDCFDCSHVLAALCYIYRTEIYRTTAY